MREIKIKINEPTLLRLEIGGNKEFVVMAECIGTTGISDNPPIVEYDENGFPKNIYEPLDFGKKLPFDLKFEADKIIGWVEK